jgi:hypothetical protein
MVNACRLAGTLSRQPCVAVVVGEGQLAGDTVELRGKGSVRAAEMTVVCEEDGVKAHAREWRALVLPKRRCRLNGIIEGHPQRVVPGFNEGLARIPVDAD